MKLLIKFPTRNRVEKFFSTLDIYYSFLQDIKNTYFLISIDEDDLSMNNESILNRLKKYENLTTCIGVSKSKIDAVNRDVDKIKDWDILLVASDDMIPQVKGYDKIIRDEMIKNFNDTDGVLWFNDGFQKNKTNTLSIMGKKYYERFNYIYYPKYKSLFSDTEFTEVSKILNKQIYFNNVIIKHEHPDWGYGSGDDVHIKNAKDSKHDRKLFYDRLSKKFDL